MTEVMNSLVTEAKKNRFSSIGPELSDEDVVSVWENVSTFIEKQMCQQKGVNIPGLGTFTFSQKKLDVGNNKYILIQRPVFLLSEKFAQTHQLHYTKHHVTGQIPVVQLNFSSLSFESPFQRDTVEACVKEVLQALARAVATRRNVEFTFQGIGRLQIRDSKVKMKFYKEFLNSMDGSGKLVDALKNRPGTVDSVMSDRAPSRAYSVTLPMIHQGGNVNSGDEKRKSPSGLMPPIVEEGPGEDLLGGGEAGEGDIGEGVLRSELLEEERELGDIDVDMSDTAGKNFHAPIPTSRTASRLTAPVAKASGISFHDDLMPSGSPKGIRGNSVLSRSAGATPMMKRSLSPINVQSHIDSREFINEAEELHPFSSLGPTKADIDRLHAIDFYRMLHLTRSPEEIEALMNGRACVGSRELETDYLGSGASQSRVPFMLKLGRSELGYHDHSEGVTLETNWASGMHTLENDTEVRAQDTRLADKFDQNCYLGDNMHSERSQSTVSFKGRSVQDVFDTDQRNCFKTTKHPLYNGSSSYMEPTSDVACGTSQSVKSEIPLVENVDQPILARAGFGSKLSMFGINIGLNNELNPVKRLTRFLSFGASNNNDNNKLDCPQSLLVGHSSEQQSEVILPKPSYSLFRNKCTRSVKPRVCFDVDVKESDNPPIVHAPHVSQSKSSVCTNSHNHNPPALVSPSFLHRNGNTPRPQSLTPPSQKMSARAGSVDSLLLKKPTPLYKNPTPPIEAKPDSVCGHTNAGQELCYLCHQRNRRNVPVSFTEERKRREEEEDRLLQQYQHMKDTECIIDEHENLLAKRHESQKMAAFNLGAAEAIKGKKQARDTDFHHSYVFQKRPVTPPRYLKQEKYFGELTNQVDIKEDKSKKRKADEDFLERLEQVQLAEDLALQREEHLQGKIDQTEQYKRALSAQLRFKPLPIPARVPDSSEPVFGKHDMNAEKMIERRRLAHDVYKEQLETVEQKKRSAILSRIHEQKDEEQMLEKSKHELLNDRSDRYERLFKNRRQLEEDWSKALDKKKSRELEEKMRFQSPALLVHEQCDKYKRCTQCKRRVGNCGESNIWRESRYIPGSRLMV